MSYVSDDVVHFFLIPTNSMDVCSATEITSMVGNDLDDDYDGGSRQRRENNNNKERDSEREREALSGRHQDLDARDLMCGLRT